MDIIVFPVSERDCVPALPQPKMPHMESRLAFASSSASNPSANPFSENGMVIG
jgi:hypothetical protein